MGTVLALDKDPLQLELLALLLKRDRHRVVTTADPTVALAQLQAGSFHLVVVEPVLPGHDGYRLCREILHIRPDIALLILSERAEEEHIVRGLRAGAEDYITKPFSPHEFLARVDVVLRRAGVSPSTRGHNDVRSGEIVLDASRFQAVVNGRRVGLTPREFALLHALMTNPNRVLTREQLMRIAWGEDYIASPKTVDVYVQRIRRKIQPFLLDGTYVHAVRGFGYKFEKALGPARSEIRPEAPVLSLETSRTG